MLEKCGTSGEVLGTCQAGIAKLKGAHLPEDQGSLEETGECRTSCWNAAPSRPSR